MSHSTAIVGGGADDFMLVTHVVVRGSNQEIGHTLAEIARAAGAPLPRAAVPTRNRARRRWFEHHWPQHYARMQGIAAAYEHDLDDDEFDFSRLEVELLPEPGAAHCSAMWVPRRTSATGIATVDRNFDLSTGTVSEVLGATRQPGEVPVGSRPYVIETYPDDSAATVVATLGDLTGCIEGWNEHGLAGALLADDEAMSDQTQPPRPTLTPHAGLNETHLLRFVLDTCASAAAAREALYGAKQYDEYLPTHFLIADSDDAFVWERDLHNAEHTVDASPDGLCVTNHLLHRHADPSVVPDGVDSRVPDSYARLRTLYSRLRDGPLDADGSWAALEAVRAHATNPSGAPPVRTLWHAQYDLDTRAATFAFYLGDNADGSSRLSAPTRFALQPG